MELPASLILGRWLSLSSVMILFGASLFELYAPAGRCRWPLPRATLLGLALVAGVAQLGWLADLAARLDPAEPLSTSIRALLFETSFGPFWIARLLLAAGILVAAVLRSAPLLTMLGFGWLGCEGWDGHAAAQGLSGALVQAIHVIGAGAWLGGLLPLSIAVRGGLKRGSDEALPLLRRFSGIAIGVVLVIVASGALNAWNIAGLGMTPGPYMMALGAKLLLVGLMVMLAANNRFVQMPRLAGPERARVLRRIAATTLAEQVLGLLVVLDVSALGLMSPLG